MIRRFLLLGFVLLLAGCGGGGPQPSFEPLRYDYLTKLRLNVASITIDQRWVPQADGDDLAATSPVVPVDALRQMASDRLQAVGSSGRAVFVIEDASIRNVGDQYRGTLAVRLEISTTGGTPAAYAEATVHRERPVSDSDGERQALYDMTRAMLDDMNVEFEYQVRHALRDWLQTGTTTTPTAVPTPVQTQDLGPPPP